MKARPRLFGVITLLFVGSATILPFAAPALAAVGDQLTLVHQDLALAADAPLTVVLHSAQPYSPATDTFSVTAYQQIVSREALTNAIDDDPRRFQDNVGPLDPSSIAVDGDGNITLTIPTESSTSTANALQLPIEGLYPIVIDLRRDNRVVAELLSFVYRRAINDLEPKGSMNVAVIASITAPPAVPGTNTPLPQDVSKSVQDLAAYADFGDTVRPTVSISPEILTSNRIDPATLDRLRTVLSNSVVLSQPKVPFDPSSAIAVGQTERFTQFLRDGENDTAAIAEVPTANRESWLTHGPLTTEAASMLRDLGFRVIVMSPDDYYAAEGSKPGFTDFSQLFRIDLPDDTQMNMGVIDPGLNDRLLDKRWSKEQSALFAAADIVAWREQAAESLAPVSGRTIALGLSAGGVPDPAMIERIAEMASATGAATFTTGLSDYERSTEPQLINGLALDVTLHADPAVDLAPRVATLNQLLLTSKSVGSMLAPDDARKARWQQTIDTLWSTSLTDADVANAAAALNAEFNAITAGVVPPQPYSFSLNGRTATVPVRITNTLDEQLVVVVRLSAAADKLTFPEGDQLATLAPNTVTDVAVPVVARTNGFFEVRLDILTPSGVPVTKTTTLRANVSTLTGLAQVLTGAALLILITWWVHNYRRSRRVRRSLATLPNHPSNGAARLATAAENPIAQTDITQNDVPADHADASAHSPPSPDAAAADAADAGDVSTDDVTTAARTDGRVPEPRARAHSRRTGRTPEHRRPDL